MTLYPSTTLSPGATSAPGPDDLSGYATSVGKLTDENVSTGASIVGWVTPQAFVSVAFDADLTRPANWIDVTAWVRGIDIRTGRQMELDEFQTGTCTVLLDGNDGRFNPQRPDGPYVGYLTPLRRVRVLVEYLGRFYSLWHGFAESWEPSYRNGSDDETVTLRAADAFKVLSAKKIASVYYQPKKPSDRIEEVIGDLPGIEYVSAGDGTVIVKYEAVDSPTSALALARDAAAADLGILFCDEEGRVRFEPRTYRALNETTDRLVFGERSAYGEIPYIDAEFSYNDEQVYTEIRVTAEGQVFSTDSTVTSTAASEYGERTLALSLPIVQGYATSAPDNDPDTTTAASFATQLRARYEQPGVRLNEITYDAHLSTAHLMAALETRISHRVRVIRRPAWATLELETSTSRVTGLDVMTSNGIVISVPVFVERIEHSIRPKRWMVKYGLSPADALAYFDVAQTTLDSTSAAAEGATTAVETGTTTVDGETVPTVRYGTTSTSRTIGI